MEINKYNPRLKRFKNIGHTTNANTLLITPQPFTRIAEIRPMRDEVILLDADEKLQMKLVDATAVEFGANVTVRFGIEDDREDAYPLYIGSANYGPFRRATLSDQRNVNTNGNLKVFYNFKESFGPVLPFGFGSKLFIEVNEPAQIDWSPTDPGDSEFVIDLEIITLSEARARGIQL